LAERSEENKIKILFSERATNYILYINSRSYFYNMSILLTIILFSLLFLSILFLFAFTFYILFIFTIPILFYGAVFARSSNEIVEKMVFLAKAKPGKKAADVGSGDGRLVIAMAKAGIEAHGYEINPFLVWASRRNIKKLGLSDKAFVHLQNFWKKDFSEFDIVTVYGISYIMKKLEEKLKKELKKGSKVVSNYFIFSDWPYAKKEGSVYLYLQK